MAFGLAVYVLYQVWHFIARPDALQQIGVALGGIGLCLGAGIGFILIIMIVAAVHAWLSSFFQRERIEHSQRQMAWAVNRVLGQAKPGTPFLTKEILFILAHESRFRTKNAHVTFVDSSGYDYDDSSETYNFPAWEQVDSLMKTYIDLVNERVEPETLPEEELKKLIDELMLDLYKIHPLRDGNKRLAFAVGELVARKYGYTVTNESAVRNFLDHCAMAWAASPQREVPAGVASIAKMEEAEMLDT